MDSWWLRRPLRSVDGYLVVNFCSFWFFFLQFSAVSLFSGFNHLGPLTVCVYQSGLHQLVLWQIDPLDLLFVPFQKIGSPWHGPVVESDVGYQLNPRDLEIYNLRIQVGQLTQHSEHMIHPNHCDLWWFEALDRKATILSFLSMVDLWIMKTVIGTRYLHIRIWLIIKRSNYLQSGFMKLQ